MSVNSKHLRRCDAVLQLGLRYVGLELANGSWQLATANC